MARIAFFVTVTYLIVISSTPFPQWVVNTLEVQHAPFDKSALGSNADSSLLILILGGGHSIAPTLPPNAQLSRVALVRLVEGIRVKRQIPNSKIVLSGFSRSGRITQAQMLADAALLLGVLPSDTLQNRTPRNTDEEILFFKNRFGSKRRIILVTSANHMPRAIFFCNKYGIEAIPAPTDFYIKRDPLKSPYTFKPSLSKLEMIESAIHEYLGMVKAKWIG